MKYIEEYKVLKLDGKYVAVRERGLSFGNTTKELYLTECHPLAMIVKRRLSADDYTSPYFGIESRNNYIVNNAKVVMVKKTTKYEEIECE